MKKLFIATICYFFTITCFSQNIGIGTTTPDASAMLDVSSSSKGVLIPKMTTAQKNAIASPTNGLIVFQTDSVAGLYYNSGTTILPLWERMVTSSSAWTTTGNAAINSAIHYIGTSDNQPLLFKVNNIQAGLIENATRNNIAFGSNTLISNVSGYSNVALGVAALRNNIFNHNLVAIGDSALFNNNGGFYNTAIGSKALYANSTGYFNTANGYQALYTNSTGHYNTANGYQALYTNTTGLLNTANGSEALYNNSTGQSSTANGYDALFSNTTGSFNTASGYRALDNNESGSSNTAFGSLADVLSIDLTYATAIGADATVGCNNCLALGGNSGTGATKVGINNAFPSADLHIIQQSDAGGNTSRGIMLQRPSGAQWRQYVDANSLLTFEYNNLGAGSWGWINTTGTFVSGSDVRIKKNINPLADDILSKLLLLQPKKYLFKNQNETENYSYGFIAQEVQKIFPEFVSEKEGGYLGIAYHNFGVIAVKAIQQQQSAIEDLKKENAELKKDNAELKNKQEEMETRLLLLEKK